MRALTKCLLPKCLLLVVVTVCVPDPVQAQISRFFKRSAARQTHIPNHRTASISAREAKAPASASRVRQAQFEDVSDPIVPSPLTEADVSGLGMTPALDSSDVEQLAPPATSGDSPPPPAAAYARESSAMPLNLSGPIVDEMSSGDPIYEAGIGQSYDIPLSDVVPQDAAETYSTNDWFRNGNWYSKQEFVMLLRADLPLQHLAVDLSSNSTSPFNPNITPSLDTKNTDFTFEAGTRLTLGHRLGRDPANRDHSLELVYFGLFDYTGRASLTPVNPQINGIFSLVGSEEATFSGLTGGAGFVTVNPIDGMTSNVQVDLLHQSDFNSFEFNYVLGGRPAKDRLIMEPNGRWVRHATPSKVRGLFAGVRYVRQDDLFQYRGVGQVTGDGVDLDVGGRYVVTTDNDLIGVQLGSELAHKRADWVFGLKGKGGGLINFAERHNLLVRNTDSTETGERVVTTEVTELKLEDESLTFLVEGSAYASYYIRPNTVFRLGYDVLYLNGMATATNNLGIRGNGTEFARFEVTGDSLYHGMSLGLELTW